MSKKKSSNAPGPYLGFTIQTDLFLLSLLRAQPGETISVEVFEDLGVTHRDGSKTAKQSKSALVSNPVSDRAVGLWKTLSKWVDEVSSNKFDRSTRFQLWVSPPRTGELVLILNNAQKTDEVLLAYTKAKTLTLDSDELGDTVRPYVENFFKANQADALVVLTNFSLHPCSSLYKDELLSAIKTKFVPPENQAVVLEHAAGWIHNQVSTHISLGIPAEIAAETFNEAMAQINRKFTNRNILDRWIAEPAEDEISKESTQDYYLQMELIDLENKKLERGVKDFLMASSFRTKIAEDGDIVEASFTNYNEDLQQSWELIKLECDSEYEDRSDLTKGRIRFARCMQLRPKIENMEVPRYFAPGCLHSLSNQKVLGWHPKYDSLLAGNKNGN